MYVRDHALLFSGYFNDSESSSFKAYTARTETPTADKNAMKGVGCSSSATIGPKHAIRCAKRLTTAYTVD